MPTGDLRDFNFYQKYLWSPTDFTNFQLWIREHIKTISEGAFGGSILSGFTPSAAGGLSMSVAAGIAVSPSGVPVVSLSPQTVTFASPAGNPARSLIVARPKTTQMTSIPQPTNPSLNVFLHAKYDFDILVLNGNPAATPAFPATNSEDIVLAGVYLAAAASSVSVADIEWFPTNRQRPKVSEIRKVSAGYTVAVTDEIIEADATSGAVVIQLPSALTMQGQRVTVVKIDSSSNSVSVSGNGGETISGSSSKIIDSQHATVTVYSNTSLWRSI